MKTLFAIAAACALVTLQTKAQNVLVSKDNYQNWKVSGNGIITIETPQGEKFALSEKFMTPNSDWTPSQIQCVWSPTGVVAVFAQHPRLTEIIVFDTKSKRKLSQKFLPNTPPWYEDCRIIIDRPVGEWTGNTLKIETTGTLRSGEVQKAFQLLEVKDGQFSTRAAPQNLGARPPEPIENEPGVRPVGQPTPEPELPHGIEFGR